MNEALPLPSPLRTAAGHSIPLLAVELRGEVIGGHAHLVSTQRYRSIEAQPVEAIYVFPLPSDAAVTGFVMEVGGRRLEAEVKEREAAFRAYDDAITSGHGAALIERERPNVFTANVGNLLPGEDVSIEVRFVMKVACDEGALRLFVPTLVAPRYVPGQQIGDRTGHGTAEPTHRVPDADRISPPVGDANYTLSVALRLHFDARATIGSPSHDLSAVHRDGAWDVALSGAPLDRDLVVLIEPAAREALERVVAHREGTGPGYVALTWVPDLATAGSSARNTFSFVLDRSGSMGGLSIEEARRALRLCLRQLREGDAFEVIAFDDHLESFRPEPVPYTERTLAEADRWIAGIDARGGTELLAPLLRVARNGSVVVLLTDGQVGNEDEILREVLAARAAGTRIYSFGIGTNVSDVLLGRLAQETGGAMELIHPGERIDEKVVATFAKAHAARVSAPVIEVRGIELDELAPSRIPDLVDGEPWTVLGRYAAGGRAEVVLRGTLGGRPFVHTLIADLPDRAEAPLVPTLWARERIRDLEQHEVTGRRAASMKDRIVALAIEHHLASRHTSFVVIEKRTGDRRATDGAVTRAIPVHAPHGWALFEGAKKKQAAPPGALRSMAGMSAMKPGAMPKAAPAPQPKMRKVMDEMLGESESTFRGRRTSPSVPAAPSPVVVQRRMQVDMDSEDDLSTTGRFEAFAESSDGASPTAVETLLQQQRASGTWDADPKSLSVTVSALRTLLREDITTLHAIYGANVKKAVDAIAALASVVTIPSAEREAALILGYLLAQGRRTRAMIVDAIRAHAPHLEAQLADEAALRAASR